jgi:hypothetical protein
MLSLFESTTASNESKSSQTKLDRRFNHHRQPKEIHHRIETIDCNRTMDELTFGPDGLFYSCVTVPSNASTVPTRQRRSLTTVRTWWKTSSMGQFVRTFGKRSKTHTQETRHVDIVSASQSKQQREYSDAIY